jgi:hypothetical protein
MKAFGQESDERRFPRSSQGDVAHADDFAGQRKRAKEARTVEADADPDDKAVKKRK